MYRKGLPALRHSLRRRSLTGGGPRDDEPGGDVGRRRRCSLLQTPRSSSSSSEEEEEEEEEELIASKRSREMRRKHNAPSKQVEPSSSYDGIRRSTRQRKVIFENVSDSWIVGNRAVRGYPDYLRSPRHVRVTRRSLRAVRYTSANGLDEDDDEVEEPDDDVEVVEEEQTRSKTNGTVGTRSCRRILRMPAPRHRGQPPRIHQRVAGDGSGDDEDEGGNAEVDQREEEEEGGGSSGDEADGDHVPEAEDSFQDMYARVKRRRRAAAQQRRSPDSMSASENNSRGYSLRKTKPAVQRFQIAKPSNPFRGSSKKRRRRISTSSSSSSSSSSSTSDKRDRDRRDRRKKRRELVGKVPKQSKLTADTGPMTLDSSIRFSEIGGLQRHVNSLKEMILFPILYPDIFRKFGVTPPKGVLFHGPPGTGKTLMARALANECSQQGNRKVSFFMRKGADVLSKWVGESERQLRLLFEEAHQGRPSIIFFDELDGLAPVRSSKQDQIHSSIVCTLLALMDGLDNRGDIIIIGATNRIDSIDPALRRPGRFDRELHFPLPGVKERREILGIHAQWAEPDILNFMAERTAGYCGSDLRALCTESVIHSMQRVYPQIYHSTKKLLLQPEKVKVERIDFLHAFQEIVPSAKRHWLTLGRKMPTYLDPLLSETLATLLTHVGDVFPYAFNRTSASHQVRRSPRLLLVGDKTATSVLSTGLLYKFEHCSVLNVAFHTLYSEPGHTPEEVLKMVFKELPHQSGAILWFGDVSLWWNETSATVKATLESMLAHMDQSLPVLYLATSPTSSLAPEVIDVQVTDVLVTIVAVTDVLVTIVAVTNVLMTIVTVTDVLVTIVAVANVPVTAVTVS
ncbi:ATPase family associated with various cellular activities (AAA) [Nesidiocoris tenuis]|uniref:ATPase family associated with various cellular activities (AAA) n=1 Tax=Nesidiocoris tenuis TaxID=355587 RepID=A0ABN7BHM9_9HEMI|nr:ATPase family associated with various cellular activities (AAA) [Nesidiocoris tenuis]